MNASQFLSLVNGQRGHFLYESGYHSDLWLDLETLCHRPTEIQPLIQELCREVEEMKPEVICGPLVEGGLLALLAARELGLAFVYSLRLGETPGTTMFPIAYELPKALKPAVAGKRVAVVNDVISAGSAVRGTWQSLKESGAEVVGIASLVVLGDTFYEFAKQAGVPVKALLTMENNLWEPEQCPLCAAKVPLQKLADH